MSTDIGSPLGSWRSYQISQPNSGLRAERTPCTCCTFVTANMQCKNISRHEDDSDLVLDVGLLVLVEVDLVEPRPVEPDPRPLADDLGGVDEVVEDGGVDGHQGAGDGPLLLQLVRLPRWLGQDSALGDEDHVLPGKLLLQLAPSVAAPARR